MKLIEETIARIPVPSSEAVQAAARSRWDSLTKPRGSLGVLEDAVVRLAAIQGTDRPAVDRQVIYVFCGDHGITEEGVSAYPSAVTREMMKNFVAGGAAINVLCKSLDIEIHVIDAGLDGPAVEGTENHRIGNGTRNFATEPSMSREQAISAVESGIRLSEQAAAAYNLVGVGEMGIGNSTAAAAILCALTGLSPQEASGRGAGLDDTGLDHKRQVIADALAFHSVPADDPISVLAAFGGFEIAAMAGFILGSAARRLPVVIDGFIASAGYLVAQRLVAGLQHYVLFAHQSAEPGHQHLLNYVGASPLLHLKMRLGEGTGAALAMHLLRTATALYDGMATFEQAAISEIRSA